MTAQRPCDEIAADAVGLVALPADAPERLQAEAHARTCADCARALEQATEVLALLDLATLPAPSPAALARASAAVVAESDRETAARTGMAVVAAVIAAWAIPLALMRAPIAGGPSFALSFLLAMLAATASLATVVWSRRAAIAFPALSALAAVAASRGAAFEPVVGVHCAAIEVFAAVAAGGTAWLLARALTRSRGDTLLPSSRPVSLEVAAVGGGALAGHAALHLGCSAAHELPHVLAFHTAPVAVAVALALLLAGSARGAVRGSSRP